MCIWCLPRKESWVFECLWEVLICHGTTAVCFRGSEKLLAARWVRSGLIFRDPWLLPLLLPVFLAFCSLLDFLPEGQVRAVERSPPIYFCRWSLDWVVVEETWSWRGLVRFPESGRNTLEVLQVREGEPGVPGCFFLGGHMLTHLRPVSDGFLVVSKRVGGNFNFLKLCLLS